MDNNDALNEFDPILDKPDTSRNGRVTTAELYKALYLLDLGLSKRFTSLLDNLNSSRDESQQLRADLENHRADHPGQALGKQTGKLALLVTFFTAVFTALATVAQRILN